MAVGRSAALAPDVEALKGALREGNASASTLSQLQALLAGRLYDLAAESAAKTTARTGLSAPRKARSGSSRPPTRAKRLAPATVIHEDVPTKLSTRERYSLATETVNICLKTLTDSLRAATTASPKGSPLKVKPGQRSPNAAHSGRSSHDRALQPCSGNNTPLRNFPVHHKPRRRTSGILATDIAVTAECARHAFSFLRSTNPESVGVKASPRLQLENGMLALVGKLIAHGLERQAVEDLRIIKQRLEIAFPFPSKTKTAWAAAEGKHSETSTLASLMQLRADFGQDVEARAVGITHYLYVLKIIGASRKAAHINALPPHLDAEDPSSVVQLLCQQAAHLEHTAKAVKQLDSLSHTLLSLCPSVAASADEAALDAGNSANPDVAFRLQALALRIRTSWWKIAKHKADIQRDLIDPFLKCARAFARRTIGSKDRTIAYHCLTWGYGMLTLTNISTAGLSLFNIHHLLCLQAEHANLPKEAHKWAERMSQDCATLEEDHVRRLICLAQEVISAIESGSPPAKSLDLHSIIHLLQGKLTGNSADYDVIISTLARLVLVAIDPKAGLEQKSTLRLCCLSASFALRYARSYPGENLQHVRKVIDTALCLSRTSEDLLSWVNENVAVFYIQLEALKDAGQYAESKSLQTAWTVSRDAVALSRILRVLIFRAAQDPKISVARIFDQADLASAQRGLLLETQLAHAVELAAKPRSHAALSKVVPEIVKRLGEIYSAARYPLRRARVAIVVLGICEAIPAVLPFEELDIWSNVQLPEQSDLGCDVGLQAFMQDIRSGLAVSAAFSKGRPSVEDLKPSLQAWEHIITRSRDRDALLDYVDDPIRVHQQFEAIAAYFGMLGEDAVCLATRRLIVKLLVLIEGAGASSWCVAQIHLAATYMRLGFSEKARQVLEEVRSSFDDQQPTALSLLQIHLARAELHLATDDLHECEAALEAARCLRSTLPPSEIGKHERRTYELLHAQSWLLQSRYLLTRGSPYDSLAAGKTTLRILNSIWSSLERAHGSRRLDTNGDVDQVPANGQPTGVSKLQLTPLTESPSTETSTDRNTNGAAFWVITPLLCEALRHLSDLYAHHGLYSESNYYSERAIAIAESLAGSSALLSRLRSHRSRLLTLAGKLEEAELCLAQDDPKGEQSLTLAVVERYCAQAALREKEGAFEEAAVLFERAETLITSMSKPAFLAGIERLSVAPAELDTQMASMSLCASDAPRSHSAQLETKAEAKKRAVAKARAASQRGSDKAPRRREAGSRPQVQMKDAVESCYMLTKWRTNVLISRARALVRGGNDISGILQVIASANTAAMRPQSEVVHARASSQTAWKALQGDVTLNMLAESTLSCPGIARLGHTIATHADSVPERSKLSKTSAAKAKSTKKINALPSQPMPEDRFVELVHEASTTLLDSLPIALTHQATARIYERNALLLDAYILLSAVSKPSTARICDSSQASLFMELPSTRAVECGHAVIAVDQAQGDQVELLSWPSPPAKLFPHPSITAAAFQAEFVDILPKSWTAVSLCLNEDASELYIARYCSGETPLILRLPFSRHKSEDLDGEAFDYFRGKAELREIVELSNYTCHNSGGLDIKGAKTKWWNEREALDRRMHELLINIENIWIGGFKGVLSPRQIHADRLEIFASSFETLLDRYLPSRQNAKSRKQHFRLHDQVLQLFIGLGDDQDGAIDLDEPIADLLYFVVDMLQFGGERNAYDEIDFDGMTVDVLDALRIYYDGLSSLRSGDQHVILVLEKRLQSFPWENLPCLQEASVSRVGSMLSLRERILAMRKAHGNKPSTDGECCTMKRSAGSYILNPSSDLVGTQTALQPMLSTLSDAHGRANWTALVNQVPNEAQFKEILQSSSMVLYFGHGAGSQYIRPRAIKKLKRVCDVVWLMGCSSGSIQEFGELEPFAVPLAYLLAGQSTQDEDQEPTNHCKAVVATLWDVTDKDIDRFSLALGETWGLWPASEQSKLPMKTPKKRQVITAPTTPQQIPKTPKTPRVGKTPAPLKTPVRDRNARKPLAGEKVSLVEAVAKSRDACYLRYLNGAAPVVYGIPVYLGD